MMSAEGAPGTELEGARSETADRIADRERALAGGHGRGGVLRTAGPPREERADSLLAAEIGAIREDARAALEQARKALEEGRAAREEAVAARSHALAGTGSAESDGPGGAAGGPTIPSAAPPGQAAGIDGPEADAQAEDHEADPPPYDDEGEIMLAEAVTTLHAYTEAVAERALVETALRHCSLGRPETDYAANAHVAELRDNHIPRLSRQFLEMVPAGQRGIALEILREVREHAEKLGEAKGFMVCMPVTIRGAAEEEGPAAGDAMLRAAAAVQMAINVEGAAVDRIITIGIARIATTVRSAEDVVHDAINFAVVLLSIMKRRDEGDGDGNSDGSESN
ncbi:hypothetical protein DFJ74DRAFT_741746 [Hyaloraphidium curvatum]|nr:hypothetical protein DFJ74DRAFT_741746 [Hyaloraphidium curvatum]